MLQRPQTLYMLAALACLLLALAFPVLQATLAAETYQLYSYSAHYCAAPDGACAQYEARPFQEGWAMVGGAAHVVALGLLGVAIGSFKKRPAQVRLLALANLLTFLCLGAVLYGYFKLDPQGELTGAIRAGAAFLLLAPVLNLVAINKVRKDENLVRSMNRLR